MKWLALAVCLLLVACNKKRTPDAEVDRYINQDLAPHLAKIMAARAGYNDLKADAIDVPENLPNLQHRLTDAAYPFLAQALDGLSKITPPQKVKLLHDDLVYIVKQEQTAIGDMSQALDPVDKEKFRHGHAKIMDVSESVFRWERKLDDALLQYAVKMKELPKVEIPERRPAAPVVADTAPAAEKPAAIPCKPGTEVKDGDKIVECTTTEGMAGLCSAGKMTFHDNGKPKTCTTEMMFSPPETAGSVVCGPGALSLDDKESVVSCMLVKAMTVDGTAIPKGSKVKLGANGKLMSAELPDGKVFTAAP